MKDPVRRDFDTCDIAELCRPLNGNEYSGRLRWSDLQCSTSEVNIKRTAARASQAFAARSKKKIAKWVDRSLPSH